MAFTVDQIQHFYHEVLNPPGGKKTATDPRLGPLVDTFDMATFFRDIAAMDDEQQSLIQNKTLDLLGQLGIDPSHSGWEESARAQATRLMLNKPGIFFTFETVDTGNYVGNFVLAGPANLFNFISSTMNSLVDVAVAANDAADFVWDNTGRYFNGMSLSDTLIAGTATPLAMADAPVLMAKNALMWLKATRYARIPQVVKLEATLAAAIAARGKEIAQGGRIWKREHYEQIRGVFLQDKVVFDAPKQWITQKQHMVPDTYVRELKRDIDDAQKAGRSDVVARLQSLNTQIDQKNMANIHGDFHQRLVHSDGTRLKNAGTGGIWNQWWKDKLANQPLSSYEPDLILKWQEESYMYMQDLWDAYKRHPEVKR